MEHQAYLHLIEQEISLAVGCTEPAAVAYATAVATKVLGKTVTSVELLVSRNILKNAMGVGIPGTDMVGLEIAAALAAICGDADARLEVLHHVTTTALEAAMQMVQANAIHVALKQTDQKLYIEASVAAQDGDCATVIIEAFHTHITKILHGCTCIYGSDTMQTGQDVVADADLTVDGICRFIRGVQAEELTFLRDCVQVNERIANEGLANSYGLCVGKTMFEALHLAQNEADVMNYAIAMTSAAADARMSGSELPVMTSCGSGNQGLTATVPVIAYARRKRLSDAQLYRAVAFSLLITIHVKRHIGRLSPLCSCSVGASIGCACALTLLMNGTDEQIKNCIALVIADLSGIICDGAKAGCSLKVASGVSTAYRSALLAINNRNASALNGIVCRDVEKSIDNLGILGNSGMEQTDRVILNMLVSK